MLPDLPKAESQTVEFKRNFNEDVPQTLTAFANAKGGSVFVGVGDSGEVKGIRLGRETLVGWLNEIKLKTTPQLIPEVDELDVDGRMVVRLSIAEYPVKPVACRGRYYKRVSGSNQIMGIEKAARLHLMILNSSWDYQIRPGSTLADISLAKVQAILERIQARTGGLELESPISFLRKSELIQAFVRKRIRTAFAAQEMAMPEFRCDADSVMVVSVSRQESPPSNTRDRVLEWFRFHPEGSMTALAAHLSLSKDTVKEHVERLKRDGLLERTGSSRHGRWVVKKQM